MKLRPNLLNERLIAVDVDDLIIFGSYPIGEKMCSIGPRRRRYRYEAYALSYFQRYRQSLGPLGHIFSPIGYVAFFHILYI